jgi:hypothetical protein
MQQAHIFQIYYSEQTRLILDPGFIPLDNLSNERPDWREYWPIRRYLAIENLREGEYYGFLSPRFKEKTGLTSHDVHGFIEDGYDLISFSPFFDQMAFFFNIFEQGEFAHSGLASLSQRVLQDLGVRLEASGTTTQVQQLVMDSRHVIFGNYFVAKPKFWRAWFEVTEKIFHIAESRVGPLAQALNAVASHETLAQAKVFVIERIASLLLRTNPTWRAKTFNPFSLPKASLLGNLPMEMILLDALKIAYNTLHFPQYNLAFNGIREAVTRKLGGSKTSPDSTVSSLTRAGSPGRLGPSPISNTEPEGGR